jgi:hypothetical protein
MGRGLRVSALNHSMVFWMCALTVVCGGRHPSVWIWSCGTILGPRRSERGSGGGKNSSELHHEVTDGCVREMVLCR